MFHDWTRGFWVSREVRPHPHRDTCAIRHNILESRRTAPLLTQHYNIQPYPVLFGVRAKEVDEYLAEDEALVKTSCCRVECQIRRFPEVLVGRRLDSNWHIDLCLGLKPRRMRNKIRIEQELRNDLTWEKNTINLHINLYLYKIRSRTNMAHMTVTYKSYKYTRTVGAYFERIFSRFFFLE